MNDKHNNDSAYNEIMNLIKWFPTLFYLNILWVVGSIVGLFIFGIGPATLSLIETLKEIIWRDTDVSISKYFISVYKNEWKQMNKIMVINYAVFLFLLLDYQLIIYFNDYPLIVNVVYPIFIVFSLLILLVTIYFFVFYKNFELTKFEIIENSLLLALSNPLRSLLMIVLLIIFYNLFLQWPIIILFFIASLPAMVIVWLLKKPYFRLLQSNKKQREIQDK